MQQVTTRHVGTEWEVWVGDEFDGKQPSSTAANARAHELRRQHRGATAPPQTPPDARYEAPPDEDPAPSDPATDAKAYESMLERHGFVDDSAPDLDVLDQSIAKLAAALATGEHDEHLTRLVAAEEGGKTRRGAMAALAARKDLLAGG